MSSKKVRNSEDVNFKTPFRKNYRKANCCSRIFFTYAWNLIGDMRKNNGKMTEEMIEDMTNQDGETEMYIERFLTNIKTREEKMAGKTPEDYYFAVRNSLFMTFRFEILSAAFIYFFGECCAIGYTSFLLFLINYLKDDQGTWSEGIILLVIFGALMVCGSMCKNFYVFYGYKLAINIRKTLIASMYSKVSKLNMQSLTETNSGKLITIVSGDI